jgi:superfamily II DNA or RNA helicase
MHIEAEKNLSTLIDADPILINEIDQALAVLKPGIQYSFMYKRAMQQGWNTDFREHLFKKASNKFPTGLLEKVLEITGPIPVIDKRFDGVEEIKRNFEEKSKVYEPQNEKYKLTYFQRDTLLASSEKGRGRVFLPTNSGKSLTICAITECIGVKTLWLVDRKELLYQAVDQYKEYTGKDCGYLGDGKFVDNDNLVVGMVQTIYNLPKKELIIFLNQFKVLVADEAESTRSKSWYAICMNCPAPFRYAFTGSAPKDKYSYYKMAACTDYIVIIRRSNDENVQEGFSATPTVYLQDLNYTSNKFDYRTAYDTMIRFNKPYASIVADEIQNWYKKGKKILVLVEKTAQGQNISAELKGRKIEAIYLQGNNESDYRKETLDDFRAGKVDVLIGTKILARGVDLPAVNVLILAAGGKSEGQQLQRIGRSLRKKKDGDNTVDIVDYVHRGNYHLLKHSIERVELYKHEGFKIVWRDDKIKI